MEIVDNAITLLIPGAMEAAPGDPIFWGSLAVALLIAGAVAFPSQPVDDRSRQGHAVAPQHP